jgi:hypothetical protein
MQSNPLFIEYLMHLNGFNAMYDTNLLLGLDYAFNTPGSSFEAKILRRHKYSLAQCIVHSSARFTLDIEIDMQSTTKS